MTDALTAVAVIAAILIPVLLGFAVRRAALASVERYNHRIFLNHINWLVLAAIIAALIGWARIQADADYYAVPAEEPPPVSVANDSWEQQETTELVSPELLEQPPVPEPVESGGEGQALTSAEVPSTGARLSHLDVVWTQQPSAREFERRYPRRALRERTGGQVVLDCGVNLEGGLDCVVESEQPSDRGFGEAALRLSSSYRVDVASGSVAEGQRIELPITFRAEGQ